jgi:ABC-type transport system substrate-binding protein
MRGIARTAGFQALLDKALQEEDQAKIVQYVKQLDKLAYEDAMFVPIFAEKFINIMHPYTKDVILGLKLPGGKPYPKLQYAWLDK